MPPKRTRHDAFKILLKRTSHITGHEGPECDLSQTQIVVLNALFAVQRNIASITTRQLEWFEEAITGAYELGREHEKQENLDNEPNA